MPKIIDGRSLTPPEPFEKTMAALDDLSSDEEILLLLNCRPQPLYHALRQSGFVWREILRESGTFEIYISRRPASKA